MRYCGEDAGQRPGAEGRKDQSAKSSHAASMAGKAGGMASVVRGVMGNVDMREADRPDHKGAGKGGKYCGKDIGPRKSPQSGSGSGAEDVRLHDLVRRLDVAGTSFTC